MGMKFFPQEVERVIGQHPLVQAVCVLAHDDQRFGQSVSARVVLHQGADPNVVGGELRALCRRELASYKVPVHFEVVAELPRTASGKVLHRAG
jgi:long-chain acyl-CoA synthetase